MKIKSGATGMAIPNLANFNEFLFREKITAITVAIIVKIEKESVTYDNTFGPASLMNTETMNHAYAAGSISKSEILFNKVIFLRKEDAGSDNACVLGFSF